MLQLRSYVKIFAAIFLLEIVAANTEWGYPDLEAGEEFKSWGGICDDGKRQSPINLDLGTSLKGSFEDIPFSNYDKDQKTMTIVNNGHTVELSNFTNKMILENGPLDDLYEVQQIHLHWWSEHTINNVRYPLEVHIVHRNIRYPDMTSATAHKDGLAVVAILYHMSHEQNDAIELIVENLDAVKNDEQVNKVVKLNSTFNARKLFPEITGYFSYPGSLTTPTCAEAVTWIVLQETFPVTQKQINKFQEIQYKKSKPLKNNYRIIQKTNNRPVLSVQSFKSSGTITMPINMLLLSIMTFKFLI